MKNKPRRNIAMLLGCTCPEKENMNGFGSHYVTESGERLFYIDKDCPIHGNMESIDQETKVFELFHDN